MKNKPYTEIEAQPQPAVGSTNWLAAENARLKRENQNLRSCARHYGGLFDEVRSIIAPGDTTKLEVLNAVRKAANAKLSGGESLYAGKERKN